MFRLPSFIPIQAFVLSSVTALPSSIWHVSVDEAPAPAPQDGPPLSASAVRDSSYLPIQIGSIVGAYLFVVLVVGSALLLVGRRLRRAAQASPRTLAMEMMKPIRTDAAAFDPSPISPSQSNPYGPSPVSTFDMKSSWPSPDKGRGSHTWQNSMKGHKQQASVQSSVVTFDESVIEDDKARNQAEMERLYNAVMVHDHQKPSSVLDVGEVQAIQHPPEFEHLRSVPGPPSPTLRSGTKSPARTLTTSPRKSIRPSPITTNSRTSSRSSFGSFGKKRGIRNLPISPPMGSPELAPEHNSIYGESEPLSPRFYQPGPPPPTPPHPQHSSNEDRFIATRLSPRRADFQDSTRTPRTSIPTLPSFPEAPSQYESGQPEKQPQTSLPEVTKQRRTPAPLTLRIQGPSTTASSASSLRSAPLPLRNLNSSRYNSGRPPSTIKATVIESKASDRLGVPRTGVPMTPYSPYMPFTPLTPMTPSRLVTKQERKRREKEEGRRVVTVEDAVEEEGDMWGDAYP